MDIDVVVPIYILNEELMQMTRDCLYSIKDQYKKLIIIDDHSPMNTREFSHSGIYVKNGVNEGYIKSANQGFKYATSEYVCLVCNDTKLIEGKLSDLCINGYAFPTIEGKTKPFWDGAFYCFPRGIKGLYDEKFHTYFGDLDKFYQAKLNKLPLTKVDSVKVYHKQSATTEAVGIRKDQYDKDKQTFIDKWGFDPVKNLDDYYKLI
jgi:GT2 family glycosyltransferase